MGLDRLRVVLFSARMLAARRSPLTLAIPALMFGCNGNGCPEEQAENNQDRCRVAVFGETDSAGLTDLEPDFEDFLQTSAVPAPGGGWIVEGDIHFTSTQHVYEHFRVNQPRLPAASKGPEIRSRSTVM